MQTSVKEDEHFWHFRDELLSDSRQEPQEGIHTLSNRITTLINNCKFTDSSTKETLKIMLLAHAVRYLEARDWIRFTRPININFSNAIKPLQIIGAKM